MNISLGRRYILLLIAVSIVSLSAITQKKSGMISGKVLSLDGETIDYATVFLKGTSYSSSTNEKGLYHIDAPEGKYTIVFSSVGFEKCEMPVTIKSGERSRLNVKLKPTTQLAEVIVVGNQLSKVKNSAFNATAVNTQELVTLPKH